MKLGPKFTEALEMAAKLHGNQNRKGSGIPYISHLLCVAGLVLEYGGNEDEAIAALLHDAIEDQGGKYTRETIRSHFGDNVTRIVDGCSDSDSLIFKPPWKKRKEGYLAKLELADQSILLVSEADKIHNSSSILRDYRNLGETLWDRFHGGKEGTLWYYQELLKVYQRRNPGAMTDELTRIVTELVQISSK